MTKLVKILSAAVVAVALLSQATAQPPGKKTAV